MLKLTNPHANAKQTGRVMADIDINCFDYFFGEPSVFCLTRGVRQALISQFFEALQKECVASSIPDQWEPENEHRVAEIMSRLNFKQLEPYI